MKLLFSLLSICIFSLSFAQQGIDYSINLLESSNLSKTQNITYANSSIVKAKTNKAFLITTAEIELGNNIDNSPLIALSIKNDLNSFNAYYKVKNNSTWSNWIAFSYDSHTKKLEQVFLDKKTTELQFKIEGDKTSQLDLSVIEYRLYYPGESNSTQQTQGNNTHQQKSLDCNCPLPSVEYRNDWCPSGNCPKDNTPTPTSFTHLVVHHSAGSNSSPDWAATVRSIWDYHVNNRGWDDVGYNYLIDPNGVIYEGRGNDVQGAHFSCMNQGAMGVCLLGNFETATPTTEMINSLIKLMGWKSCELDKSPVDTSFFANANQNLINLCGHRDANFNPNTCDPSSGTLCPGQNVYDILGTIRANIVNYSQNCTVANTYSNTVILSMDASPTPVYVNEPTQLNLTYKNIGDADINENLEISFQIEGDEVGVNSFSNLSAGQTANSIITPYTFNTAGTYQYCTFIDAASNELLTNNNSYCVNIQVENRPTSIHSIEESAFNIYPNPAKNKLFIEGDDFTEISIFNPIGQLLMQQNQSPVSINQLENGIYYIKVSNGKTEYNSSFVKH